MSFWVFHDESSEFKTPVSFFPSWKTKGSCIRANSVSYLSTSCCRAAHPSSQEVPACLESKLKTILDRALSDIPQMWKNHCSVIGSLSPVLPRLLPADTTSSAASTFHTLWLHSTEYQSSNFSRSCADAHRTQVKQKTSRGQLQLQRQCY